MSEAETTTSGKHRALKPREQRRACKAGNHALSEPVHSGGGISRMTCSACGFVMLDIRDTEHALSIQGIGRQRLWK